MVVAVLGSPVANVEGHDLERLARQHERQQREHVREALTGAVADEVVDERHRLGIEGVELVEQAAAFPDRTADCRLPEHHVEDPLAVDQDARVLLDDLAQRTAALEADLEAHVVEPEHHAISGALRHTDGKDAGQTAADGEILIRIDQGVDQLADVLFDDLPERKHRVGGDRVPGEQRDRVRHEQMRQSVLAMQHAIHAPAVARAQGDDVLQVRIGSGLAARRR